jgi:hypothetical protein
VTKEGFEGTVGPQGELSLRLAAPASQSSLGVEIITRGIIDRNGAVRARQTGRSCSYDLVWQKKPGKYGPLSYDFVTGLRPTRPE